MKIIHVIIIFSIILYSNILNAQNIRIIEILDTNRFLTEDSVKIKLANIDVPSQDDLDSTRQILAQKIMEYNRLNILGKSFRIVISISKADQSEQATYVHLFKKFPLDDLNINKEFFERGFGVYIPKDMLYKDEYVQAARYATKNEKGIWKGYQPLNEKDMFNRFRATF